MTEDLLDHFIVEARELVQQATDDLLALEREPGSSAHLDGAFRAVHTLKGSVGLFDFAPMGLALHAAEDVLGAARAGQIQILPAMIGALLDCIAQTERWIDDVAGNGGLPPDAHDKGYRLAQALRPRLEDGQTGPSRSPREAVPDWAEGLIASCSEAARSINGDLPLVALRYTPRPDCFFMGDDPMALLRTVPALLTLRVTNREPWPPAEQFDPFSCNMVIEALSGASLDAVKAVFRFVSDQVSLHEVRGSPHSDGPAERSTAAAGVGAGAGSRVLRVDASRVDRLADLVGELIVAKNTLAHLAGKAGETALGGEWAKDLLANQAAIDRLVGDMHQAVTQIRMLPMRDTFQRFPRAVRDAASQLGKGVDFAMEGEDVEADKSIVEGLFEPLLHVIRNAVAHGAESEHLRREAGKSPRTRITLRARRTGDLVLVDVEDDGRGIDPARVRQAALDRGLISREAADRLTDADAIDLIFAPGFSTAAEVTDLSGRGVGMDAVRAAVERLGGRVTLHGAPGKGTNVRLSLPLTVVMTKVMTVRVGGELYGLPIDSVAETTIVPAERILPVRDAEAFVLRDRTIPLLRLAKLLAVPVSDPEATHVKVVVMQMDNGIIGLAVDGFAERMDVLLRPMTGILSGMPGIVGTTLLGDGSVLMVLDVPELIG